MKAPLLQRSLKQIIIALILILHQLPMFSQADTLVSFWQGSYTPTIIESNISVTNLTVGPGITAYDCSSNYIAASGFDQGFAIDGLNNGDYWEFSITPDPGFQIQYNWYEIQRRASWHPSTEMNTLGTVYWKIGSGNWIQSLAARVDPISTESSFCNNSASRRPHFPSFSSTETVTFRIVRYIYDNDNQGHNRVTKNGYQWVSGIITQALPVELSKFDIYKQDQNILLEWETASEINNLGFEVERSSDGQSWDVLDFVEGNGTTPEMHRYSFIDKRPLNGHNYYRLKQIDFDQTISYSDIKELDFHIVQNDIIHIYPNPAHSRITANVSNPDQVGAVIKLYSSLGRVIWERNFRYGEMESSWTKDFDLPKEGIYFLSAQVGEITETKKIIIIDKR